MPLHSFANPNHQPTLSRSASACELTQLACTTTPPPPPRLFYHPGRGGQRASARPRPICRIRSSVDRQRRTEKHPAVPLSVGGVARTREPVSHQLGGRMNRAVRDLSRKNGQIGLDGHPGPRKHTKAIFFCGTPRLSFEKFVPRAACGVSPIPQLDAVPEFSRLCCGSIGESREGGWRRPDRRLMIFISDLSLRVPSSP